MASPRLVARGAEAELYLIDYMGFPAILKYRVSKPYRHPVFDRMFRYRRTLIESRVLARLNTLVLPVPGIYFADPARYVLVMEYIEGKKLSDAMEALGENRVAEIASAIGVTVSVMHRNNIYHGDLTLANILVRGEQHYLIDFGLSGYSRDVEEYAIDIHLLERSVNALYPELRGVFMESFWRGYGEQDPGFAERIRSRVEEIRLRGRYVDRDIRRRVMHERYM